MISIRHGGADDLDLVSRLHVQSRQHAYSGIIPQDNLDSLDPAVFLRSWQKNFTPDSGLFLAEDDGTPAGFCHVADGWLTSIHVLPRWHGGGVGLALLNAGKNALRDMGFAQARLWVVAGNARARRFYEREGWRQSGQLKEQDLNGALTPLVEYICDL